MARYPTRGVAERIERLLEPDEPRLPWLRVPAVGSYVRVFPADEVTSVEGSAEVDPREAGLARADVDAVWASVVRLYRTGLHPAVAISLRRGGKVVLDRAIGHTHGNSPGEPLEAPKRRATPRSLFNVYSASKAVTAMLVHLADDRGLLHLDDAVAEYIPEFARHGKERVTIRHILTHRAGIPTVPSAGPVDIGVVADPDRVLALLCDAKPVSVPGRRLAYHALTGGFVLGAILERVTGMNVRELLRREVTEKLGFENMSYGVAPSEVPDVAINAFTGPPPIAPYSWLLERSLGVGIRDAVTLSNAPRFLTAIVPAGNVVATPDAFCRFFQLLLDEGEQGGVRVFDRRTVRRAVAEQSYLELDATLAMPVRYGMGFMLGGEWLSLYGAGSSRAFGHLGFTNVVAWADPERDISCALMTTGKPFLTPGQLAFLAVPRAVARACRPVRGR